MFVWVLEGKVSDPEEVGRQLGHWIGEFGSTTPGYLGATGGVTDDRRFLLFVRWESEEAGNVFLARPEQQAWYEEFQKSFDGPVEFTARMVNVGAPPTGVTVARATGAAAASGATAAPMVVATPPDARVAQALLSVPDATTIQTAEGKPLSGTL